MIFLISVLSVFIISIQEIKAQINIKFECQILLGASETSEGKIEVVVTTIDWSKKVILIDYKDETIQDMELSFVAHEYFSETKIYAFYFNSSDLKVAMLDPNLSMLAIQFKDESFAIYVITKQL